MKCQNLFSGKNKNTIISLSSAEFATKLVKVKVHRCVVLIIARLTMKKMYSQIIFGQRMRRPACALVQTKQSFRPPL